MTERAESSGLLKELVGVELASITFVRDYVQLGFDGPVLNAYASPYVTANGHQFDGGAPGHRDALCGRIGARVTAAQELRGDRLVLRFSDKSEIGISLREVDRCCAEAAMFQFESGGQWMVWP